MGIAGRAVQASNLLLNRLGLHLAPKRQFDELDSWFRGPRPAPVPLPPDAADYLTLDNPRLAALSRTYQGHPAAGHTQWADEQIYSAMDQHEFRGDNHYLYQTRYSPILSTYALTFMYVRDVDQIGALSQSTEDGLFGAYTVTIDDERIVSRDLLDSINQINFIARTFGLGPADNLRGLDIGAGYGRLAHRFAEAWPGARVTCTDAVALSTFLSEYYLGFRQVGARASVLPLDQTDRLRGQSFDLVTNIHSFSEAPLQAIAWWFDLLDAVDVKRLLIVPNRPDQFRSTEKTGQHSDYRPILERHGWRHTHAEPIYAKSNIARRYALYPNFKFHLFER
jgi:hypothetical protein